MSFSSFHHHPTASISSLLPAYSLLTYGGNCFWEQRSCFIYLLSAFTNASLGWSSLPWVCLTLSPGGQKLPTPFITISPVHPAWHVGVCATNKQKNRYMVFHSGAQHRILKTFRIYCLFCMLMKWPMGVGLESFRMEAGCQKIVRLQLLEFSVLPPTFILGRWARDWVSSPMANNSIDHVI